MEEPKEIIQINLTKVHLILSTIILVVTLITPFIAGFVSISQHTENLMIHERRLTTLEAQRLDNRQLLLELKFNLKKHMNEAGETYIEGLEINVK